MYVLKKIKALMAMADVFFLDYLQVTALMKSEDLELHDSESLTVNASTFKVVSNPEFFPESSILTFNGKRKIATCSRCKTVMYPGRSGALENHKKGYCADGVRQKPKVESTDSAIVRELYDKVIDRAISDFDQDYSMEDDSEAFSRMLSSRVKIEKGQALFLLFDTSSFHLLLNFSVYAQPHAQTYLHTASSAYFFVLFLTLA
jgi:hypothetical protein